MSVTLAELSQRVEGRVIGTRETVIERVAAIAEADAGSLAFATDERYFALALESKAGAVLADAALVDANESYPKPVLAVPSARMALTTILKVFERPVPRGEFRHASAVVEPTAQLGDDVYVGALAYIGEGAIVGPRTTVQSGAVVAADARVGAECLLNQGARILEGSVLGDRVVIGPGAVIGSEGFGWAFDEGRLQKIPQIGNVVLGDDVEIGANTCIDRAQTGSTRIGKGTKIDNLCQIGHNSVVGEHSAIAAQCGLAGTTIIGSYVQVGGQAGFRGHITIGSRVKIAGGSAIWGDVADDEFVSGRPARPHKEELRREVMVRKLPKLFSRVDALETSAAKPPE
ncbi:MAG: UDP-3-O-(3-hydroxymyristoyl)glucosamine N-acyltransferase [Candidatus Baltobacteraceae bacterium]